MISKRRLLFDGYTLVELTIFIALIGLIIAGITGPLNQVSLFSPKNLAEMRAINLAKTRMELLLNQNRYQGFDSVSEANDPCQSPIDCQPTGYSVNISVQSGWSGSASDSNFKTIIVTVSGRGEATLETIIAR